MPKSKPQKTGRKKLSSRERLFRSKTNNFIEAEKSFWKKRYALEDQYIATASTFDLRMIKPKNLASVVWGLRDGAAFVRYQTTSNDRGSVEFRAADMSLGEWGKTGLIIPTPDGEMSLARAGIVNGLASVTLSQTKLNGI